MSKALGESCAFHWASVLTTFGIVSVPRFLPSSLNLTTVTVPDAFPAAPLASTIGSLRIFRMESKPNPAATVAPPAKNTLRVNFRDSPSRPNSDSNIHPPRTGTTACIYRTRDIPKSYGKWGMPDSPAESHLACVPPAPPNSSPFLIIALGFGRYRRRIGQWLGNVVEVSRRACHPLQCRISFAIMVINIGGRDKRIRLQDQVDRLGLSLGPTNGRSQQI